MIRDVGATFPRKPLYLSDNVYNNMRLRKEHERRLNQQQKLFGMKTITYRCSNPIPYPVGQGIGDAIAHAKGMSETFMDIYPSPSIPIYIFCRGSSGAIFAALFVNGLSLSTQKHCTIYHIKKNGEDSHCNNSIPNIHINSINVIIDDLICSGSTLREIYSKLNNREIDVLAIACNSNLKERTLESSCGFVPKTVITSNQPQ